MIKYRKGNINDLSKIQDLHSKLFEYEQSFEVLYDLNYDKTEDSKQYFKSRLISDNSFVYVAEEHGSFLGYICGAIGYEEFRKLHDVAEIDSLFVSEEYRGKGIGEKLIERFILWTKTKNINRVKLEVVHNNERSISFYNRKGFKPTYLELELINK